LTARSCWTNLSLLCLPRNRRCPKSDTCEESRFQFESVLPGRWVRLWSEIAGGQKYVGAEKCQSHSGCPRFIFLSLNLFVHRVFPIRDRSGYRAHFCAAHISIRFARSSICSRLKNVPSPAPGQTSHTRFQAASSFRCEFQNGHVRH